MKVRPILVAGLLLTGVATGLNACRGGSPEQEVKNQKAKVYYLNADERSLAKANAQAYFEQQFPTNAVGKEKVFGKLLNVQPSDSNKNGLVSANGYVPNLNSGALEEKIMYCPYTKDSANCSVTDTVK